jgi:phosphate:Na+ symporter
MLIAVTMASRHIFDFDQTLMVILGAHIGSSVITYATGIHFTGQPRQVVAAQVLYSLFGTGVFLVVFIAEHLLFGRSAFLGGLSRALSADPGVDAALVAALMNTVTPSMLMAGLPALYQLCVRLAPPLREEDLGRPQFLRAEVSDNPVATLLLAEKEQLRLLRRLPTYCAWIRGEAAAREGPQPAVYHQAFGQVSAHIERFQNELMSQRMASEDAEWLINQQKRQECLAALDEACWELCGAAADVGPHAEPLRDVIVEALDTLLLTAIGGMAEGAAEELDSLAIMSRDRGPAMERMRRRHLADSAALPVDDRLRILQMTSLFERAAWSLNRFGALLAASPNFASTAKAEAADRDLAAARAAAVGASAAE